MVVTVYQTLKKEFFLFTIPFFNDDRQEAKRRRRRWVNFVDVKRKNFAPSKGSSICSKHFRPEDLTVRFALLPGQEKPLIPRLKRDEIGLCVYPTLQTAASCEIEPVSDRTRRKVRKSSSFELVTFHFLRVIYLFLLIFINDIDIKACHNRVHKSE